MSEQLAEEGEQEIKEKRNAYVPEVLRGGTD